ncbi:MAG: 30S ribosomal protein S27e [Nitrosopumilaceae archaeon]|nr:30S ribosomal protein S27e [Nitrosopumilaceae archaeon]
MKKDHIPIPVPSSRFQKVTCKECEEMQVVYSHATTPVTCNSCGNLLTESTGSKTIIFGQVVGSAE